MFNFFRKKPEGERKTKAETQWEDVLKKEYNELLARAYEDARRPYRETVTQIPEEAFQKSTGNSSWRYFLEINSGCNLHCVMCVQGDLKGFEHKNGIMSQDLFEKIADKIQRENSTADVCLYGNSEPFMHPRLAQCVASVRKRGLTCLVSTNLTIIKNLRDVLEAQPSILIVSLSGFTQEIYGRTHKGGNIEVVKRNMQELARLRKELNSSVPVLVHYHLYRDNWGDEFDKMKAFALELGFGITSTWARSISMEKSIQYLRYKEKEKTGSVPALRVSKAAEGLNKDWTKLLPEVTDEFLQNIARLGITPDESAGFYKKYPTPIVCPVGDLFTYIRYDGSVSLCACFADMRLIIAPSFLDVTQEEIRRRRRWQSICYECLRYKMNLYFHILDIPMWDDIMAQKFPEIPPDRRKF